MLVLALLFTAVITTMALAAMMTAATELKIAVNDRSSKQAFYTAEAGLEDVRSGLQNPAAGEPRIKDRDPSSATWMDFVGKESEAASRGYRQGNHSLITPLTDLNYVATITHKVIAGNILKWGDSNGDGIPEENPSFGENILVVTSYGRTPDGAEKAVRIETSRVAPISSPAAVYAKGAAVIGGNSTVTGMDASKTKNLPGVMTRSTLLQEGDASISGEPFPYSANSSQNLDLQYLINNFKKYATLTPDSGHESNRNWGTPVFGDSPSCTQRNIIYYQGDVKLSGTTSGCGLLLIQGNLEIKGQFNWYGVIVVKGNIDFSGGGNVAGAILSGGDNLTLNGNAVVTYCTQAITDQTFYLPWATLRWLELFS